MLAPERAASSASFTGSSLLIQRCSSVPTTTSLEDEVGLLESASAMRACNSCNSASGIWGGSAKIRSDGQTHSLWRIRSEQERGLGECGHRSRYGAVRGASHRPMVEEDGPQEIPRCKRTFDNGRRRWQQRQQVPLVEGGIARIGCAPGDVHSCLPLPTGHQQVEQNRASHVLPHYPELAGTTLDQSRGDH